MATAFFRTGFCKRQCFTNRPSASQLVRPSLSSSGPSHGLGQRSLGEFAVLTPTVQLAITPRRLQRRQGQHPPRRPTHPPVLATLRHRPVVVFLHPRTRDP